MSGGALIPEIDLTCISAGLRNALIAALNERLIQILDDPREAPQSSFDEVELFRSEQLSIYAVDAESRSLFGAQYVSGNAYDETLCNVGSSPVKFSLFRQKFVDGDFDRPMHLEPGGGLVLLPGFAFLAKEGELLARPSDNPRGSIYLSIRSASRDPHNWMYDVQSLAPAYVICADPRVTYLLILIGTISNMRWPMPAKLTEGLRKHSAHSVRWAYGEYLMRNHPDRAVEWLADAANTDAALARRARARIEFLRRAKGER